MSRTILTLFCLLSLALSPAVFAKNDKDNKGPNEMAYEKANEQSSFNREEEKQKKEKKEKKEKKNK